jgi:hypothetical protein
MHPATSEVDRCMHPRRIERSRPPTYAIARLQDENTVACLSQCSSSDGA